MVLYLAVSVQGSVQAVMSFNRFVHFSDWVIGHSHLAMIGFESFAAMGAVVHIWQHVPNARFNRRAAAWSYWLLMAWGMAVFAHVVGWLFEPAAKASAKRHLGCVAIPAVGTAVFFAATAMCWSGPAATLLACFSSFAPDARTAATTSHTSGPATSAARRPDGPSLKTIPGCSCWRRPSSTRRCASPDGVESSAAARRRSRSRSARSNRMDNGLVMHYIVAQRCLLLRL